MTTTAPPLRRVAVCSTVGGYAAALEAERRSGRSVGIVPTMGALHEGHASLIRRAAAECDVVAVSIFVNPTQFSVATDLDAYPRTLDADLTMAAGAGASVVFAPATEEMYPGWPTPPATTVTAGALAARWEGESRPGHFDGVATVVVKLLAATGPSRAYFGEKDFQQLAVVRQVVRDLSLPVEVVGCPIVREADGLALSSRNARLSPGGRSAAVCLSRALAAGAAEVVRGGDRAAVEGAMAAVVATEPLVALDYAALVGARDLEPVGPGVIGGSSGRPGVVRLLVAATVDTVRLIDNLDPWAGR